MDLLTQIINCKTNEEVNEKIKNNIEIKNNEKDPIEQLGFLDYGKNVSCYKGFIPLSTRIKYASNNIETYGMNTTDYFYDFAFFIRKCNINNKTSMIYSMEYFINCYFGMPGATDRQTFFNEIAWKNTSTDDEYFAALENNRIGDLKEKGAAECTERSALAQQLLSLFGTESYYCMGCVDLGNKQEGHCFNIVKRKNDYALLDYSIPICSYNNDGSLKAYYPFIGKITNEEFQEFITEGTLKQFNNYQYINGNQKESLEAERKYVVGAFTIEKGRLM